VTLPGTIAAAAPSEWPMPLLLDEAWLRAHRALVHALEADGLWPEGATQRTIIAAQHSHGEQLRDGLLFDLLGPEDFAHTASESLFGAANGRFRRRLPFVLAFGYELGLGLHAMACDGIGVRGREVGEASAIFNLGISMFDLIADTDPTLFGEVSAIVDAPRLRALVDGQVQVGAPTADGRTVPAPEVRILIKMIEAFFRRLRELEGKGQPPAAHLRDRVATSLMAAHSAELQSAGTEIPDNLAAVSEAKSTLPFVIIGDLALLGAGAEGVRAGSVESLVSHVKAVYWLTDDLADIVTDFQSGALNSLLARSGGVPHHERDSARDYPVLAHLLASREIEETAEAIRQHLRAATVLARRATGGPGRRADLGALLACYVRDWIE
jgi:hypothetical protein